MAVHNGNLNKFHSESTIVTKKKKPVKGKCLLFVSVEIYCFYFQHDHV